MVTCATVMKSLLVAAVVVVLSGQGSAVEKLADCCTQVDKEEITQPILGFLTQAKAGECVNAIIFQTETGFFCSKFDAPWVRRKIKELMGGGGAPHSMLVSVCRMDWARELRGSEGTVVQSACSLWEKMMVSFTSTATARRMKDRKRFREEKQEAGGPQLTLSGGDQTSTALESSWRDP
ncbi:hypothetical protein N1851_018854 [Merluccius polli]|uniref:Chemokine interleukin-8-like domain-containing protein n=1 Tax=Merluccius polli TaxID=89951 RepID=A0AA47NZL6_MERPO|nr:hypothetical protein N1851_018854 [Merluccius polli]